jgi:hypothetical protein
MWPSTRFGSADAFWKATPTPATDGHNAWYVPLSNEYKIAITSSRVQGYVHSAPLTDFVPVWMK